MFLSRSHPFHEQGIYSMTLATREPQRVAVKTPRFYRIVIDSNIQDATGSAPLARFTVQDGITLEKPARVVLEHWSIEGQAGAYVVSLPGLARQDVDGALLVSQSNEYHAGAPFQAAGVLCPAGYQFSQNVLSVELANNENVPLGGVFQWIASLLIIEDE